MASENLCRLFDGAFAATPEVRLNLAARYTLWVVNVHSPVNLLLAIPDLDCCAGLGLSDYHGSRSFCGGGRLPRMALARQPDKEKRGRGSPSLSHPLPLALCRLFLNRRHGRVYCLGSRPCTSAVRPKSRGPPGRGSCPWRSSAYRGQASRDRRSTRR